MSESELYIYHGLVCKTKSHMGNSSVRNFQHLFFRNHFTSETHRPHLFKFVTNWCHKWNDPTSDTRLLTDKAGGRGP